MPVHFTVGYGGWFSERSARVLTLALLVTTGVSCSGLAGRIDRGRYQAPGDVFSVSVPRLTAGLAVQDDTWKHPGTGMPSGYVSFHDDFGHVRSIQYEQLDAANQEKLTDPARAADVLGGYLRDVTLVGLRRMFPKAEIVHQRPESLRDGSSAWFAVFHIPEGSPLMVMNAEHPEGRRLDSTRAFLMLFHGDLMLTLSTADDLAQTSGTGVPASGSDLDANSLEDWKRTLVEIYESMRFG